MLVGQDVLDAFVKVAPHLNKLLSADVFVDIGDTEKILAYQPGETVDIKENVGDLISQGGAMRQVINTGRRIEKEVPASLHGVPYRAVAEPVFDEEGNTIGIVLLGTSLANQVRFQEIVQLFGTSFEEVNNSIQEIAKGSQNLATVGEKLSSITYQTKEDVNKTDDIIQMIRHIATQTKMLGLNAAIEAARAGEHGRGFAVVAEEIRRLSEESNSSAKQVATILSKIVCSIDNVNNESQETSAVSEEQAAATEEIAATVQDMMLQLEQLEKFARLL